MPTSLPSVMDLPRPASALARTARRVLILVSLLLLGLGGIIGTHTLMTTANPVSTTVLATIARLHESFWTTAGLTLLSAGLGLILLGTANTWLAQDRRWTSGDAPLPRWSGRRGVRLGLVGTVLTVLVTLPLVLLLLLLGTGVPHTFNVIAVMTGVGALSFVSVMTMIAGLVDLSLMR